MLIRKYQGKSLVEIQEKYYKELGKEAILLNIRQVRPRGIKKLFCSIKFEAIVAVEDYANPKENASTKIKSLEKLKKNLIENSSNLLKH